MNERKLVKKEFCYCFKKYKFKLCILYLVTILSNLISLIPLYLFGDIIDFITNSNIQGVKNTLIKMIGLFLITTLLSVIETLLHSYLNEALIKYEKERLYKKILYLKMKEFDNIYDGELMSKVEGDTADIVNFVTEGIVRIIMAITTMIITIFFAINISFKLSVIAVIVIPIILFVTNILNKKNRKYIINSRKLSDKRFSCLSESFNSLAEIKSLNIQEKMFRKYSDILSENVKNTFSISVLRTCIHVFNSTVTSISDWFVIIFATILVMNGEITVGNLVAFNSFIGKFGDSVSILYEFKVNLQTLYTSILRTFDLIKLDDESELDQKCNYNLSGNIKFDNVHFAYNNDLVLKGVNLDINQKSFYVIVGANGCGKSTLLNQIMRLYDSKDGKILFDNNIINDFNVEYLRRNIAYVRQQPYIFEGTVEENLLITNSKKTLEDVKEACRLVEIDNLIESLPDGYKTKIGTEGVELSGGERQKLAIARGILQEPKIMLLDEITSDLDSDAELKISALLKELSEKFTVIMVAHRISTVLECPNIIVMDSGKVVAQGNHEQLIKNCEVYKKLYKEQIKRIKVKSI